MARIDPVAAIGGVLVATSEVHADERGSFVETYRREWFPDARPMVQANLARRRAGVVVGLHYHRHQADLWSVASGRARVVLHDLRRSSPTSGATVALDLCDAEGGDGDGRHLYIPPGVAHGFAAHSDLVLAYQVDRYHDPADEMALAWDDPDVAADWGLDHPTVSRRDREAPRRADIPAARWPR
ncbi:dTDP-4-dehydrorhamnose 3,5-epimerase [soil metagenome]